jgi:hypothetical protein
MLCCSNNLSCKSVVGQELHVCYSCLAQHRCSHTKTFSLLPFSQCCTRQQHRPPARAFKMPSSLARPSVDPSQARSLTTAPSLAGPWGAGGRASPVESQTNSLLSWGGGRPRDDQAANSLHCQAAAFGQQRRQTQADLMVTAVRARYQCRYRAGKGLEGRSAGRADETTSRNHKAARKRSMLCSSNAKVLHTRGS